MRTIDPQILQDPSQSSIYRGRVALDPLVQRLGTSGEKRSLHCKTPEHQSYEVKRVIDLWIYVAGS
jgi:hypothetical protein